MASGRQQLWKWGGKGSTIFVQSDGVTFIPEALSKQPMGINLTPEYPVLRFGPGPLRIESPFDDLHDGFHLPGEIPAKDPMPRADLECFPFPRTHRS